MFDENVAIISAAAISEIPSTSRQRIFGFGIAGFFSVCAVGHQRPALVFAELNDVSGRHLPSMGVYRPESPV